MFFVLTCAFVLFRAAASACPTSPPGSSDVNNPHPSENRTAPTMAEDSTEDFCEIESSKMCTARKLTLKKSIENNCR